MNSQPISDLLKSLPPDLPTQPDRFDQISSRARRRRLVQVAGVSTATVLGGIALTGMIALDGGGTDRGIDPAQPSPDLTQQVLPGAEKVIPLTEPVTHAGDGTEAVDLGAAPDRATAVATQLTCHSAGRIEWPDGSSLTCEPADVDQDFGPALSSLDLVSGQSEFVMSAKPGVRWTLVTYFVRTETTPWGVNAKGETFGVENENGEPDLIRVVATNGRQGYLYADELDSATGGDVSNPKEAKEWMEGWPHEPATLTVYESDGETVVGQFETGEMTG